MLLLSMTFCYLYRNFETVLMCWVVGGDNYTRRPTQTSVDGSAVYLQDFSSRRCKHIVVVVSCTAVWLSRVADGSDGHGYRSQELVVGLLLFDVVLYCLCTCHV